MFPFNALEISKAELVSFRVLALPHLFFLTDCFIGDSDDV